MDYKNDNRTPRDRITGEFLSELLFTDLGGDSYESVPASTCGCTAQRVKPNHSCNSRGRTVPRSSCKSASESRCSNPKNACSNPVSEIEIVGNYSLAMAYVQMQKFDDLFDIDKGFCEGTIFKGLRFPFYPTPCRKECD